MPTLPQVSAAFTVIGQVPSGAVAVAGGSTVNLELVSDFGVKTWRCTVVGTHAPGVATPTIPDGASTSFTVLVGSGPAYLIECVVNSGRDGLGRFASGLKVRALVGVVNAAGVVPFAVGEKLERSVTHGWVGDLNQGLRWTVVGSKVIDDTSYTLQLEDNFTQLIFTSASPVTVTVPPDSSLAWPDDVKIVLFQRG